MPCPAEPALGRRFWCIGGFLVAVVYALCGDVRRNIVSTVNMDCRLELKTIALHARNAEYNPKVRSGSLNGFYPLSMFVDVFWLEILPKLAYV